MALWGNKEALALTGTVATTNGSATVTGTSTVFTTEAQVGDVITVNSTFAKIIGITSNTALTISPAWAIANTTGVSATLEQSPKWLAAGSGATVQSIGNVYGVDAGEATANNEIPGWVYTNVYTDMHGNIRRKSEVLCTLANYRWQRAANANVAFADLTNTGTFTNTTTTTLNFANSSVAVSGSIYRVQMSVTGGTGANTVSANAVLTIA